MKSGGNQSLLKTLTILPPFDLISSTFKKKLNSVFHVLRDNL